MRIVLVICIAFLIVSQFFCKIDGTKNFFKKKTKSTEQEKLLKAIRTDLEKCAKSIKVKATKKLVLKCLTDIKKQKDFLDKDKSFTPFGKIS